MKIIKMLYVVIALLALNLNATEYTSIFKDNGMMVTEVRSYITGDKAGTVETWEWLDLTVTNGITFSSIEADLLDDGLLNNSSNLTGFTESILDIENAALAGHSERWSTVSDDGVIDLFNSFFGLDLIDDQRHDFYANSKAVESFISLFGDTYHEGSLDMERIIQTNGEGFNSGYSYGITNTEISNTIYNEAVFVYDGQMHFQATDSSDDFIISHSYTNPDVYTFAFGTWLIREALETETTIGSEPIELVNNMQNINSVSEPPTWLFFSLPLITLFVRRIRTK